MQIYARGKKADENRTGMTIVGTCSYLMPGDDQKIDLMARVIRRMHTPRKQLRYLKIYAGFDYQFANAKWVNRREANLEGRFMESRAKDDSVPFISEAVHKRQEFLGGGGMQDANDHEWNDYDGYYDEDGDLTKGEIGSQNKVDTSPIAVMRNSKWKDPPFFCKLR